MKLRVVPAVDIRGGRCVRLLQGDYSKETVYSEDPVAQAKAWHTQGAELVHIVDLDGAKLGQVCVLPLVKALVREGVPIEVGGGIRTLAMIETLMAAGADRVILGTAAHRDPELLRAACARYPGRIAVGIDAKQGMVALQGWLESTFTEAVDFARRVEEAGAARIIYTDILRDGTMQGPNIEATRAVAQAVNIPVTASGGVSSIEDICAVTALLGDGVDEVIVGRALYSGAFSVRDAIAATRTTS